MTIPDAPWIRDAELNGVGGGEPERYECPCCGAECPDYIYTVKTRYGYKECIGCSECIQREDGWDYADEHPDETRVS